MSMQWFYAVFNLMIAVVAVVGPLLWLRQLRQFWRHVLAAGLAVAMLSMAFGAVGTTQGWWTYNNYSNSGPQVFGASLEHMALFIVVPLVGLVALYALGQWIPVKGEMQPYNAQRALLFIAGIILFCMVAQMHRGHTLAVTFLALGVIALLYRTTFISHRIFWYWNACMVAVSFLLNALLVVTVVTYDEAYVTGVRLGPVPIEVFLYTFSLCNIAALVFRAKSWRAAYATLVARRPRIAPIRTPRNAQLAPYQNKPADSENDTM